MDDLCLLDSKGATKKKNNYQLRSVDVLVQSIKQKQVYERYVEGDESQMGRPVILKGLGFGPFQH